MKTTPSPFEWPTLVLLFVTYCVWFLATDVLYDVSNLLGIVLTGLAITQFSSLQHEALHGHPFRNVTLNEVLVSPAITLTVPYRRFRDTHIAHHNDPILTDPYDDPESNYFDPKVWQTLPTALCVFFKVNNTLLGRMIIGPFVGNALWLWSEARLIVSDALTVRWAWALHLAGLVPVIGWLWVASMPFWAYLLAAWIGHGILKIRTFLEHRAHVDVKARTVIVEDRGPLSILFLNNNYHAVHHSQPKIAWYRLPRFYAERREDYLMQNHGYRYRNYMQVFARYALRAKDPVAHPLYPKP